MDRSDRDRERGRQVKRPKTSTSSSASESRQHTRDRESSKTEEKSSSVVAATAAHEDVKPVTINKKELYEKISKYEFEEAKEMDLEKAHETYTTILANFEDNVAEVMALKREGALDEEKKLALKMEGLGYITSLKTLNRLLKYKLKSVKDEQFARRMTVDSEHLKLQNLLYEATHLQNQVAAVQDYKSMDEKIDLIPVEQFYKEAPERVTKPDLTANDPHLLRIARLEYEFIQRQKLTEQCSSLEKEKEVIAKCIEEKQAQLDSVKPMLKSIQEATLPLEEFYGLDISAKKTRNDIAKFLSPPLFVLFVQSEAYQESAEGKRILSVKIGGDVDAAKELLAEQEEDEDESDSERNNEPDADVSDRRTLRKRSSVGTSVEDNRKRLFQKHPLWVEWIVKTKGIESVAVHFYYLTKLKIVTVTSTVRRDSSDGTASSSISANSESVLNELFPNDSGVESPNPANIFILNKMGISAIGNYLKEAGRPYSWAQTICGVEFPALATTGKDCGIRSRMEISCRSIEGTLKRIRKRLTNQSKLWSQLKALESKSLIIPAAAKELLPAKNSTNFVSWESIEFETYCSHGFSLPLVQSGGVSAKDTFFRAILQRGTAKMTTLIAVKIDFPFEVSVFCVQLDKEGKLRNASNDAVIRDIETDVNVHVPKEFSDWSEFLISIQLHKLMACCDVILESDFLQGESEGPSEFSREKLLLGSTSGRNLRRPFQFVNQKGGYFIHRY